jgi:hypothetical protein
MLNFRAFVFMAPRLKKVLPSNLGGQFATLWGQFATPKCPKKSAPKVFWAPTPSVKWALNGHYEASLEKVKVTWKCKNPATMTRGMEYSQTPYALFTLSMRIFTWPGIR